jgi:glycogen debranching enzyme
MLEKCMKRTAFIITVAIILLSNILLCDTREIQKEDEFIHPLKKFEIIKSPINLSQTISPHGYIEASGKKAAILGNGEGELECWIYPFKILRNLRLRFLLNNRSEEFTAEQLAAHITVNPDTTIITYSHPQFTVQEILCAPIDSPSLIILLDIDTQVPLTIAVEFLPELKPMWPGSLGGQYARWDEQMKAFLLSESRKKYAAYIGSPLASRYFNAPAHRLADAPNRFELDISPDYTEEYYIPIIIAGGPMHLEEAGKLYNNTLNSIEELYKKTQHYYSNLLVKKMSIVCPDEMLNLAFQWGKVALNKGFVINPYLGSGLIAGYGLSGRSERLGFCWFFGGDAFINSLAMTGYGDFEIIKETLELFQKYQREDGKIMHEMSQSASMIPWFEEYTYAFYHADTTPYFIVAMHNYIHASGDIDFLKSNWNSIEKAYKYCLAADTDDDGLIENSQAGLGAVETGSLLQKIKVDIYLAGIWTEALECLIDMAKLADKRTTLLEVEREYQQAKNSLNNIFWNEDKGYYSFALLENGERIDELTIWPTIPMALEQLQDNRADNMLKLISTEAMSTDWGVRMLSSTSKLYDPVSYNNGSVWPFLTGFVSLSEYKSHRAIPAFDHLRQNAMLTFKDSQGYITELLSGDFFRALDSSVPHQLFSSSTWMVAFIRGLLGIQADAINKELIISPHLPSSWNVVKVKNLRVAKDTFDLKIEKERNYLELTIENKSPAANHYSLLYSPALPQDSKIQSITMNGKEHHFNTKVTPYDIHPLIEFTLTKLATIRIKYQPGFDLFFPQKKITTGDSTQGLKFISSSIENESYSLILQGQESKSYTIMLHIPWEHFKVSSAKISDRNEYFTTLNVSFPRKVKKGQYSKHIISITKKQN